MGALLAFFGALAAACCDLRNERIPNVLIAAMWAGGLAAAGSAQKLPGALAGAAVPVVVLMPLWRRRAMGAGDIKLLSGIGSLLGLRQAAAVFAWAVLCAALIGAGLILADGFAASRRAPVHFAVPVFMGVLLAAGPALC